MIKVNVLKNYSDSIIDKKSERERKIEEQEEWRALGAAGKAHNFT